MPGSTTPAKTPGPRAGGSLSQLVGDRIARIIGGAPGSVQIQPNASIALASVASCFDFAATKRNKVVTSALDFPSMEYIWEAQRAFRREGRDCRLA